MLVREKAMFTKGLLLMGSFLVILFLMFQPVFPGGHNGLEYSDEFFNQLSKGSSFFIPEIAETVKKQEGKAISLTFDMKSAAIPEGVKNLKKDEVPAKAAQLLTSAGFEAAASGSQLTVKGDLAKMLSGVLADSEAMFKAQGQAPQIRDMDGKAALTVWWNVLNSMIKPLQKEKQIEAANLVDLVAKKGIEPAYNFYGVESKSVLSSAGLLLAGLLIFYVVYTMWYGYAIFDIFGGIGLSMKKSKVKKEH